MEQTFMEKVEDSQAIEKGSLLVAGTTIIPVGIALLDKNVWAGIVVLLIGVGCLILREWIKIK